MNGDDVLSDISYKPLIDDMTWSYSRINCYEQCRYRWFLKYIRNDTETPQFYASYGKFMHKLIEMFYRGELTKEGMKMKFLTGFQTEVEGKRPSDRTVQNYIQKGVEYLNGFEMFPYNMVDVELKVNYEINGIPFVGFIDYLGEKDGEYYIVDNKSRELKERSGRKKPTKKDEELDEMLKQLYLYAAAVKQKYGKFPKGLCFNCFKNGVFIEEPFIEEKYNEAVKWAIDMIEDLKNTEDFKPNMEFFGCYYLCGYTDDCEYWNNR